MAPDGYGRILRQWMRGSIRPLNYEKTFLRALEDVENAFVDYASAKERAGQLREAEQSANHAYRSMHLLYKNGVKDYLSLQDAQLNHLTVGGEKIKTETALSVSLVSLYRVFSGGWNIAASVPLLTQSK